MIVQINDHFQKAKARLLTQFKQQPRIEGLLEALCIPIQELEDVFFNMMDNRSIYSALGQQLDLWGEVLAQPRNGITDDELYRITLLAKVAQNISKGTPEDVIVVYKLLMRADYIEYQEEQPARFSLTAVGSNPIGDISDIKEAVRAAKPAGVADYLFSTVPGNPLVFDGDPDPNGRGLGTTADNTIGGTFSSVV